MNDTSEKTWSLAITEKRPHRPAGAGCVGIFFQLFDWNRRFAKKKLFPKKLLPPARAKQASKKFGGDEKQPKLRLIADENSGGFPNVKKHGTLVNSAQKHGVQTPGLVARLMGLESMPAVHQDKLKKASSEIGVDRSEEFVGDHHGVCKGDQKLENGGTKHELRPQKLQKTGPFERLPVTRFGAEALQFRNVLSRSRKHQPKLSSPVKSPKSLSSRNVSRLIGAATKILEPGLQVRNRAKLALTYSKTVHHVPTDEALLETMTAQDSNCYMSEAKLSKGYSSCRNCGNLLDIVNSRPKLEEQQSVFGSSVMNYANSSSQGSERSSERSPMSSIEQEKERVCGKGQLHFTTFANQAMDKMGARAELISDRMSIDRGGQRHWHLTSQQCKREKDLPPSIYLKHKSQRQKSGLVGRDTVPPRSKSGNLQSNRVASAANAINKTKDFVSLNRNLSGRTRSRIPTKVDSVKFGTESKFGNNRRDDYLSPVRKRRSMNVARQGEGSAYVSSTFDKEKHTSYNAITGKEMGQNAHSMNLTCIESRLAHLRESNRSGGCDNDVVSFTFSSPMKHKSGVSAEMEKRRDRVYSTCKNIHRKSSILDGIDGNAYIQRQGDTLGAVLAQKLKELTCQEDDELALECTTPKRTSAMILQELISALNAERPYPQDDVAVRSGKKDSYEQGHMSTTNRNTTFQVKPNIGGASIKYSQDSDNLSPGSVLEASFSIDSCFSDSLDDDSRHKLDSDSMDCSYDKPHPLEPNADSLDSATSLNNWRTSRELVTDLPNHISEALCTIDFAGAPPLKGIKLVHAKDVVMNTELLFRNAVLHDLDTTHDFSITHFLVNELEALASVTQAEFSCLFGFKDALEGNVPITFLFDSVVEYLESRYGQYSKIGFKAWTRMTVCMNGEMMMQEVAEEIRRWRSFGGLIIDELIEREMSCCLGKWTDFEIEAFEAGAEIDAEILQFLVDEVVMELWERRLSCSAKS